MLKTLLLLPTGVARSISDGHLQKKATLWFVLGGPCCPEQFRSLVLQTLSCHGPTALLKLLLMHGTHSIAME